MIRYKPVLYRMNRAALELELADITADRRMLADAAKSIRRKLARLEAARIKAEYMRAKRATP